MKEADYAGSQLVTRRGATPAQAQAAGLVLLAAGLLALVLAAPAQSAGLLITGTILAGGGHGVAVPVIGIGVLAVLTMLFTAVTGGCALAVAGWHWRNRPGPPRERAITPGRRGAASSRAAAR